LSVSTKNLAVLTVFEGDLAALLYSAAKGCIQAEHMKQRSKGFACNVVLASGGYPDHYEIGYKIHGTETINPHKQITIFSAGTSQDGDKNIITSGGRVLGVCAHAETLSEAIQKAYQSIRTYFISRYVIHPRSKKDNRLLDVAPVLLPEPKVVDRCDAMTTFYLYQSQKAK
jgi:phosphoribosylamine--glycine ligase